MVAAGTLCGVGEGVKSAYAGWRVTVIYESTGSKTHWSEENYVGKMRTTKPPELNFKWSGVSGGPTYSSYGPRASAEGRQEGTASVDGTLTFTLQLDWVRDPYYGYYGQTQPAPDKFVTMKVWGTTSASAFPGGTTPTAQTVGNGTAVTLAPVRTDLVGKAQGGVSVTADGKLLIQKGNAEMREQLILGPFTAKFSAKASAPLIYAQPGDGYYERYPGYYWDPGSQVSGSMSLSAEFDNRAAQINRAGARGDKHYTTDDGTMVTEGHTTYSYDFFNLVQQGVGIDGQPIMGISQGEQINPQSFVSTTPGSWSVRSQGTWSPETDKPVSNPQRENTQIIPKGAQKKLYGKWTKVEGATPATNETLTFTAKDFAENPVLTANAKYILHLHHQMEKWRSNPDVPTDRKTVTTPSRESPGPRNAWIGDDDEVRVLILEKATSRGTEINGSFTGGLTVDDLVQFGVDIGGAITQEVTQGVGQQKNVAANRMACPLTVQSWIRRHYLIDLYDTAGKVDNSNREDKSWPQEWNDRSTYSAWRALSDDYLFGDYNMDGTVNAQDDLVN